MENIDKLNNNNKDKDKLNNNSKYMSFNNYNKILKEKNTGSDAKSKTNATCLLPSFKSG